MQKVNEQVEQQLNASVNLQTWGDIIYNVKAFGAKGDGLTNDTIKIQTVLDTIPSGGVVHLPSGSFLVNALTVNKSIKITGEGTIKYNFTGATGPCININADDVSVEGLTFTAYGTVGSFAYKAYIRTTKARTFVTKCKFFNGMQGMHFDNGSTFGKISNSYAENMSASGILFLSSQYGECVECTVKSCGDGALSVYSSRQVSVIGNQIYTSDQGITVDGGSRYVTVDGNKVWGDVTSTVLTSGFLGIEVKDDSHYCVVSNNIVTGLNTGIALWRGEAAFPCSNNIAIGNNISDIVSKNGSTPHGMYIDGQFGCVVANNNFSRINATCLDVDNFGTSDTNVIISNNDFNLHGALFGTIPYVAYNQTAIHVSGINLVTIEGNNISCAPEAMTAQLIILDNVANFIVNSNNIRNMSSDVFVVNGSSSGVISNNQITRSGTGGFVFNLNATGRVDIRNNAQRIAGGYFIVGNATPYMAEGNVYASTFPDAMNGSAIIRLWNNENTSTGMNGGQLRLNSGKAEIWSGSAWVVVGTQT